MAIVEELPIIEGQVLGVVEVTPAASAAAAGEPLLLGAGAATGETGLVVAGGGEVVGLAPTPVGLAAIGVIGTGTSMYFAHKASRGWDEAYRAVFDGMQKPVSGATHLRAVERRLHGQLEAAHCKFIGNGDHAFVDLSDAASVKILNDILHSEATRLHQVIKANKTWMPRWLEAIAGEGATGGYAPMKKSSARFDAERDLQEVVLAGREIHSEAKNQAHKAQVVELARLKEQGRKHAEELAKVQKEAHDAETRLAQAQKEHHQERPQHSQDQLASAGGDKDVIRKLQVLLASPPYDKKGVGTNWGDGFCDDGIFGSRTSKDSIGCPLVPGGIPDKEAIRAAYAAKFGDKPIQIAAAEIRQGMDMSQSQGSDRMAVSPPPAGTTQVVGDVLPAATQGTTGTTREALLAQINGLRAELDSLNALMQRSPAGTSQGVQVTANANPNTTGAPTTTVGTGSQQLGS